MKKEKNSNDSNETSYLCGGLFFSLSLLRTFIFFTFYNCIVQMGLLPSEIRVAFPGESQLRQSRVTQPTVHAGGVLVCP